MFTIGDLIERSKALEIGCYFCGLHLFVDPAKVILPKHTPVPAVCNSLKCPQCKSVNVEPGHPLWTRPDARPPKMGAAAR